MKLEDQVCSLELARQLKTLGVKQESWFRWYQDGQVAHASLPSHFYISDERENQPDTEVAAAFTVAELGEMLPAGYASAHGADMKWFCFCEFKRSPDEGYMKRGDTEADARAHMLIYLIENKLITLP